MKLGDRIKGYEKAANYKLLRRTPLIIRVDGKAFHSFTKGMDRPFDDAFMGAMVTSASAVAKEMQGFRVAYIQSDEVTFFLTDYDTLDTQGWFDYKLSKIVSISSALMTYYFSLAYPNLERRLAIFDSRAFSVPKEEVANVFLWRAKDWERNSLQMFCGKFFSHKQQHKKNKEQKHNMLYEIGENWNNLLKVQKNGTFLIKEDKEIKAIYTCKPNFNDIHNLIGDLI